MQTDFRYDILAIGAHPDDVEHAIGGTLLRLRDQGKKICIAHMTHGEAGTFGSADLRDREARAAAEYLGADVHWLDFPDTQIEDSPEARRRIVKFIRDIRPRLIFCHYYEYPLMHPDHEATGTILRAAFRLCRFKIGRASCRERV
jgi:LmbE family N-acetylglucosaminyl deacetylase